MKKLLIVEDDAAFAEGLVRSLSRRGFLCFRAHSVDAALLFCKQEHPTHVLLDLNLGDENTLEHISALREILPHAAVVVLTGYGTIPTTVEALKKGADHYLCKPATPDVIAQTLDQSRQSRESLEASALFDVENDHILRVLEECQGNISQAARALGLHRRTLQRKLKKI